MDDIIMDINIDNDMPVDGASAPEDMVKMATKLSEMRKQHAALKKEAAEIWNKSKEMEALLASKMEDSNIKSFKSDMGTVYTKYQYFGKIVDMDKAVQFFAEEGIESDMMQTTVKKGRLNSMIADLVKNGHSLPDGIDYSVSAMVGIRKA